MNTPTSSCLIHVKSHQLSTVVKCTLFKKLFDYEVHLFLYICLFHSFCHIYVSETFLNLFSEQNLTYFLNKTMTNMNKNLNFSFKGKQKGRNFQDQPHLPTFMGLLFLSSAVGLNSAGCGVQWKRC